MRKFRRLFARFVIVVGVVVLYYQSRTWFQNTGQENVIENVRSNQNIDKEKENQLLRQKELEVNVNSMNISMKTVRNNASNSLGRNEEKIVLIDVLNNVYVNKSETQKGHQNKQQSKVDVKNGEEDNKNNGYTNVTFPPFVEESPDDGPGEHGQPFIVNVVDNDKAEYDRLLALNSFNQFASDRISIHRRLDDTRNQRCIDMVYPSNLPMASVIVCFHNEAWSVLLRSVHSIIDRSPEHLLREIILVDDFSSLDHLKKPLDLYMARLPKVKIVRATKREGLIRARLLGYEHAEGPVLVFLDSHIECFPGWLEPLLARIQENPRAVPVPCIPIINKLTFATKAMSAVSSVGIFKWNYLTFTWGNLTPRERQRERKASDPVRSPTMPGGLFAIDKKWFTTLGTYDPELDHWGGENIELSFKVWMCNGTIETIPCSNVGHIYRDKNPITWPGGSALYRNSMRVAEVWMDDYKETFYAFSFSKADFGDVSERKKLRDSLHCHDFEWYLDNVLEKRPPVILAQGEIRSAFYPMCLDTMGRKASDREGPEGYSCHGKGSSQQWVYTKEKLLMNSLPMKLCFDGRINYRCSSFRSRWKLDYERGTIQHEATGLCLTLLMNWKLDMKNCTGAKMQKWILPKLMTS